MKRTLFILAIAAVLLAACGAKMAVTPTPSVEGLGWERSGGGAPEMPPVAVEPEAVVSAPYDYKPGASGGQPVQERLVIKNADLAIVVADPEDKMDVIAQMAEQMGGFVVSSSLYQTTLPNGTQVPEAYITIRVPAEKLDDALAQIETDVVDVTNKNTTGQDVTDQYVDLGSHLRAKEAARDRLLAIMETATKTEDILDILSRIEALESEIEVIKGQMQYFEQAAKLSSINVHIVAEETIQPLEIGGWKPEGVARDAFQTLINFLQGFANFLIWLVLFILPAGAVIGVPIWLIVRGIRSAARKQKTKKQAAAGKT